MIRFVVIIFCTLFSFLAIAQDTVRPKQPNFPGDLMLDLGLNLWSDSPSRMKTKPFKSNSIGIYYTQRLSLGKRLSFYPAAGFTFDKIEFNGQHTWLRQDDGTIALDSITGFTPILKNKLTTTYFEIPLELRIHPSGTVKGEGWFIGLGVFGGARIAAHTKFKYDVAGAGSPNKEKLYDDFGLVGLRYGYQVRFGFKSFNLFYKANLNNVFKDDQAPYGVNPQLSTFGINLTGF